MQKDIELNPVTDEGPESPHDYLQKWSLSRRAFITLGGTTLGGILIGRTAELFGSTSNESCSLDRTVVRAEDLLVLTFRFINFSCVPNTANPLQISRLDKSKSAYIVVEFPPQHIAEELIEASSEQGNYFPFNRALSARASDETLLVFRVDNDDFINYKLESLLTEMTVRPLQVPPKVFEADNLNVEKDVVAFNDYYAKYFNGQIPITRIEIPFRLSLSPEGNISLYHQDLSRPLSGDRVPVWHTFLAERRTGIGTPPKANIKLLPLAARSGCSPFTSSQLAPLDYTKRQVVGLAHMTGERVKADRLILSSLGGSLISTFSVPRKIVESKKEKGYSLTSWEQQTIWGRDQYVREAFAGFLYPYGHRATYEIITKRVIRPYTDGAENADKVAFLERQHYVTVLDSDLAMDAPGQSPVGNQIAFKRILLRETRSPLLDTPEKASNLIVSTATGPGETTARAVGCEKAAESENVPKAFWLREAFSLAPVTLGAYASDHANGKSDVGAPLVFYMVTVSPDEYEIIKKEYDRLNRVDMNGQRIAYAPRVAVTNDTTILSTAAIRLSTKYTGKTPAPPIARVGAGEARFLMASSVNHSPAVANAPEDDARAPFHPIIESAEVKLDAVNQMFGQETTTSIKYAQQYKDNFFGPKNEGCVFAEIDPGACNPPGVDFTQLGDRSVGLATPNMTFVGLSALTGPISADVKAAASSAATAIKQYAESKVDLTNLFGDAKIFGVISLKAILDSSGVSLPKPNDVSLPKVPGLVARVERTGPQSVDMITEFSWGTTNLKSNLFFEPGPKKSLTIQSITRVPVDRGGAKSPQLTIESKLNDFALNLFKIVIIKFESISFRTETGKSAKVTPKIEGISFNGELEFIQKVTSAFSSSDGGGSGGTKRNLPKIEISSSYISAKYFFPLPPLTFGAFTIMNLRIGIGLKVPLGPGKVMLTLQLGDFMDPFTVAVGIFGGGGYIYLELSAEKIEGLSVSIEFGVMAALSFGSLATGKAEIKGGLYYQLESENKPALSAFIRAAGLMNVLGLITASIVQYLQLKYQTDHTLYGIAKVTVEIDLMFFSKSVELTMERRLAGSGSNSSSSRKAPEYPQLASLSPVIPELPPTADENPFIFSEMMLLSEWQEYAGAYEA